MHACSLGLLEMCVVPYKISSLMPWSINNILNTLILLLLVSFLHRTVQNFKGGHIPTHG